MECCQMMWARKLILIFCLVITLLDCDFVVICHKLHGSSIEGSAHEHDDDTTNRVLANETNTTNNEAQRHKGRANKPFVFDGVYYESSDAFGDENRICGTEVLPPATWQKIEQEVNSYMRKEFGQKCSGDCSWRRLQRNQEVTISTYVHVVYRNDITDQTNVPDSMIEKQMKVLNDAFSGLSNDYNDCLGKTPSGFATPFRFRLMEVTRTLNDTWHYSRQNATMTAALRKGTCSDLNIFILTPQFGKQSLDGFYSTSLFFI